MEVDGLLRRDRGSMFQRYIGSMSVGRYARDNKHARCKEKRCMRRPERGVRAAAETLKDSARCKMLVPRTARMWIGDEGQ